jgi:hypothetical protein
MSWTHTCEFDGDTAGCGACLDDEHCAAAVVKASVVEPLRAALQEIASKTCISGYDSGDSAVYEIAQKALRISDPRYMAMRNALGCLSTAGLKRILATPDTEMVFDGANFADGKRCPLAVGLGLKPKDDADAQRLIRAAGYNPRNLSGVDGSFYLANRPADLRELVLEILEERAACKS